MASTNFIDGQTPILASWLNDVNAAVFPSTGSITRTGGAAGNVWGWTRSFTGMSLGDVDLVEINEAFAGVAMVSADQCKIDRARVNVRGGAVALGHPIGASGARIVTTLTHALIQQNKKPGLASICIGGGEALALVIER